MILNIVKNILGSSNDRRIKKYYNLVAEINQLEAEFEKYSDAEISGNTQKFKEEIKNNGDILPADLLPRAFANVREAAKRTLGQRHFDVQLIGGMILNDGGIAEMKTGEGKTLVATLAVYLNSLFEKGVHVVTVNDYLAKRDSEWMGRVYEFLGLTTGCILGGMDDEERKKAYNCDVTYGTNSEFGFDYLRDNMKLSKEHMVARDKFFAVVDEVDSILIDEARTPLIISGPTEDKTSLYLKIDAIIPKIPSEHYEVDEKQKSVTLTDEGNEFVEDLLLKEELMEGDDLYSAENVQIVHHLQNSLRAHKLFLKDRDYIVKNGAVQIIDEFTGRIMDGRRWSDGLHQAVEAKERVFIKPENQTLASITYQNYFRLYKKLAGMTGTAMTEEAEFAQIYNLQVSEVPTNRDIARIDHDDELYITAEQKYKAIISQIIDAVSRKQPVLVGTVSIEKSEKISSLLKDKKYLKSLISFFDEKAKQIYESFPKNEESKKAKEYHQIATQYENSSKYLADAFKEKRKDIVPHSVLNARYHDQEAEIIADAGLPAAVTIATNMAGRGTDIQLGGSVEMQLIKMMSDDDNLASIEKKRKEIEKKIAKQKEIVLNAGGLFVLGTERHESRRIDNQLRGRSGRQGDPGATKFFLSLEDDLMRIFGAGIEQMLRRLGLKEDESIEHPWFSKAIETAQKKVEQRNFDIRKNILKFDDVINDQRKSIFEQRNEIIDSNDIKDIVEDMRIELLEDLVDKYIPRQSYFEKWDLENFKTELTQIFNANISVETEAKKEGTDGEKILEYLINVTENLYKDKCKSIGEFNMVQIEKLVLLQVIDKDWRDHLQQIDYLRSIVGLRAHGQRDPLNEFKSEAFALFENLLHNLRKNVTQALMHVRTETRVENLQKENDEHDKDVSNKSPMDAPMGNKRESNDFAKTPRNSPCPCGSGLKYKHCHGKI